MSVTVQGHIPATDPRREGECARCGKRMDIAPPCELTPEQLGKPSTGRNREYERTFLENVEREAQRRFGVNVVGYRLSVERRLELGAERYGDLDFLSKDMIRELLDETPDLASHAVLEIQKRLANGLEDDERFHHLFEASVHGALADWHARQARES